MDTIEALIKEIIDEIAGMDWSPGSYPKTLADIKTRPACCWWVNTAGGGSTSTRPEAYVRTTVSINVWAATAEARAEASAAIRAAFIGCGFGAGLGGQHEMGVTVDQTAYVATLSYSGLIEPATYRVYRLQ